MNHLTGRSPIPTHQFRRCSTCNAAIITELSPSSALPCKCGGELLVVPVTLDDLRAERTRCASALHDLADKCEANADANGNVSARGAATHMRNLALWMGIG